MEVLGCEERLCSFPDCSRPLRCKGYCDAHYTQHRRGQELIPIGQHLEELKARPKPPCDFPNCGRPLWSKGLCSSHYVQHRSGKELKPIGQHMEALKSPKPQCLFEGCIETSRSHKINYCYTHYRQLRKGQELKPIGQYLEDAKARVCTTEGCDEPHISKGYCQRHYNLWRRYKMTQEQLDSIMQSQGNVCAICNTDEPGKKGWCVDHNHSCCKSRKTCGKCRRGILCSPCNTGLGQLKDNILNIKLAEEYLLRGVTPVPLIVEWSKKTRTRHNITQGQFDSILKLQDYRCAICKTDSPGGHGRWHIDHNHSCCEGSGSCGKCIRGLLCSYCNSGLGYLKDSVEVLRSAEIYLERYSSAVEVSS